MENYEKTGYLREPFRLFHLKGCPSGGINLHYHDFYKLIIFYSGVVTYMIEGKSYVLEPGDIVLVGKGEIHKPTIEPSALYERSIIYISGEFLERLRSDGYNPFLCFERAAQEKSYVLRVGELRRTKAGRLLEQMEKEKERYGSEQEKMLLFQLLLLAVNRLCLAEEEKTRLRPNAVYNQKIIDILTYLREHLFEEITIDDLAEQFYTSKYHLMRQFKAETGYTIHRYVTEKRIAAAKELLLAGMMPTVVSERCGFQDYSTFLRAFHSCVKMTPTAFAEERKARSLYAGYDPLL